GLALCVKAGMEGRRDEAALHDANVARQIGVERAQQHGGVVQPRREERDNLTLRVHAGVGAATALDADFRAPDFRDGVLEALLHSALAGLDLPSGELGAAIGDGELVPLQRGVVAMRAALARFPILVAHSSRGGRSGARPSSQLCSNTAAASL